MSQKQQLWVATGALLFAMVIIVLLNFPRPVAPPAKPRPVAAVEADSQPVLNPMPQPRRKAAGQQANGQTPDVPAPKEVLPPPFPDSAFQPQEYELGKIDVFRQFQAASRDWTVETYGRKLAQADELNGRESYEVYAYLRACHRQPRNVEQMQRRADRVRNSERARQNLSDDEIAQFVSGIEARLIRCEALPPDQQLIPLMMDWLTLAARRGFPQAQMAYHKSIRWLLELDQWGVYRYPEQVHEYRRLAPLFLEAALESGHAEAFYEYSVALREHVLFDEDALASFAYAHAATLAADRNHPEAESAMSLLQAALTPQQQRQARTMGRDLCRTWCRRG